MKQSFYQIGEIAKLAHVSVETIRFYESKGLITAASRTESGYRQYNSSDFQQLRFVLHAKKVGFSLTEIKQLLNLKVNKESHTCEEVKSYTGNKIDEIDAKIADLQKMRMALSGLYHACCGGDESAMNCSILKTLEESALFADDEVHAND